jgi:hypothetical protein
MEDQLSSQAELTLPLARRRHVNVHERQGHHSMAIVCRRSSVSTSFMLAALRVLHVGISNALGTGSLDRGKGHLRLCVRLRRVCGLVCLHL